MKTKSILMFLFACCMQANAETICNDDGTVTFQYKNDQAKEVLVDVQFAGRNPMQKDPSPVQKKSPHKDREGCLIASSYR